MLTATDSTEAGQATPGQSARDLEGDPTPVAAVGIGQAAVPTPWQSRVLALDVDLSDVGLWVRSYLAPEYEAYLVERITTSVVAALKNSA